jgi:hypothetical protein
MLGLTPTCLWPLIQRVPTPPVPPCSVDPASGGATPAALLQHLQQLPISTSSRRLLDILAAAAAEQQVPLEPVVSWRQFWRSPQWHAAVRTYETLTLHNFALWALVLSWGRPQQAVMMAAAFGGNASTTTALTGEAPRGQQAVRRGCCWSCSCAV